MGDAYRGLTIRIGADTSRFRTAMSGLDAAVRSTQSDMRKLNRLAKLDPSNIELTKRQMQGMRDAATASSAQFVRMKQGLEQIAAKRGGMKKLEEDMEGISAKVGRTRSEYNLISESLEKVYNKAIKLKSAADGISLKKARKEFNKLKVDSKELSSELTRLFAGQRQLPLNAGNVDELVNKVTKLRNEYSALGGQLSRLGKIESAKNLAIDMKLAEQAMKDAEKKAVQLEAAMRQIGTGAAADAKHKMDSLDASIERAAVDTRKMNEAMKMAPKSIEAANARMKSLRQETALVEQKLNLAKDRLKALNGSNVAEMEKRFTTTANAVDVMSNRLSEANIKVSKLKEEYREAQVACNNLAKTKATNPAEFEKAVEECRRLKRELNEARDKAHLCRQEFNRANDSHAYMETANEVTYLDAKLAQLRASAKMSATAIVNAGMSMRNFGYGMMATLTGGALMIGMYAIRAANDIDASYRNMRKTVNGTEQDFEHLRQAALEFSQTHFTSADQILEIESIGGQLGIAVENLENFGEVVSNLDIATNLDTETISQNLGQLTNIMNDMDQNLQSGPGSMAAYGDALVRLGNNSAAQEDKIQNVMMRIASMGTISGMATPDLLALATATAATGQGAEAAGTALSKTFSAVEGAVNGADIALSKLQDTSDMTEEELSEYVDSLGKAEGKLVSFASVAGMSAEQFADAWNNRPMEAFKAFIDGLKRIDKEGGSVTNTLKGLGITSVRQIQTLQGLTQTTDVLTNSLTMSNDAWNGISDAWGAAGDAAREAQRKSEGFSGQLQILKNNAQVLAATLTDSATPIISWLGDVTKGVADFAKVLPDGFKTSAIAVGAFLVALAPLTILTGTLLASGTKLVQFFAGFHGATKAASAIGKLGTNIGLAGTKALESGTKLKALATATETAGDIMTRVSGGAFLGGAAIIAGASLAIGMSIKAISDHYARLDTNSKNLTKATKQSSEIMIDAYASVENGVKKMSSQGCLSGNELQAEMEELAASNDKALADIARRNEELAESYKRTFSSIKVIDENKNKIKELFDVYKNEGSLSALEMSKLQTAIQNYNQATGDSISLGKDEHNNLTLLRDGAALATDEFLKLAEAKKQAALADMYAKEYADNMQSQQDAATGLAKAEKARADAAARLAYLQEHEKYNTYEIDKASAAWMEANEQVEHYNSLLGSTQSSLNRTEEKQNLLNKAYSKAGTAIDKIIVNSTVATARVQENGHSLTSFASALNAFGEKAQKTLDAAKIEELASIWNGNIDSIIGKLNEWGISLDDIDMRQIGDKKFIVTDDGSIFDEQGKLTKFKLVTINDKPYLVTDDGSIAWQEGQLKDLNHYTIDGKHYYVTDDGTVYDAYGKVVDLDLLEIKPKDFKVTADTSNAIWNLDNLINKINSIPNMNLRVDAVNIANGVMKAFRKNGGYVEKLYANGGYFVDQPTVIGRTGNVTHIAGEAGREYVSKYANGGVVLPLTNPQMRPWVDAVAQQMTSYYGGFQIDYDALAQAMSGLKVVMDNGALVGELRWSQSGKAAMYVNR